MFPLVFGRNMDYNIELELLIHSRVIKTVQAALDLKTAATPADPAADPLGQLALGRGGKQLGDQRSSDLEVRSAEFMRGDWKLTCPNISSFHTILSFLHYASSFKHKCIPQRAFKCY